MPTARAGFAAAANSTLLVVGGGEDITVFPNRTVGNVEAIAAGDDGFTAMPPLPVAVHGVGGVVLGSAFYVLGGRPSPRASRTRAPCRSCAGRES
jgi:hypothetical protein